MRTHLTLAAAAILLVSVLAIAGPSVATESDYEHNQHSETEPNCRGADSDGDGKGDRQVTAIPIDPTIVDRALGTDQFDKEDKIEVPLDVPLFGEQFITFCSGENWDGQDHNTKESKKNNEAGGHSDEPLLNPEEGQVYVNPLYDGDCSGWDDDPDDDGTHEQDGCDGGTDKPTFTEILNLRASIDTAGTSDSETETGVYVNAEIWGLGRASPGVYADAEDDGDRGDQELWLSVYLEDHSDQLAEAVFGPGNENQPLCANDLTEDCFDGNYLLIPFDPIQGGSGGEGDCSSHEYQHASSGQKHNPENGEKHSHSCRRDNSALATFQIGFSWIDNTPGASATSPPTLP